MEVIRPQPLMDFDFDDARPMPFLSAPSTPKRFGDYESLTAPSSPSRMPDFYRYFDDFDRWEEEVNPATAPKSPTATANHDFAFDFNSELEETSLSADELFDGGKIRPLKPPPRLQLFEDQRNPLLSPTSPRSPIARGKNMIREVFSTRKKKDSDPFYTAAENTVKRMEVERGRERSGPALMSNRSRRSARSLSPYRVSEYPWEEEERRNQESAKQANALKTAEMAKNLPTNKSWSKKWKLKDFLLFRSASEGRASDKDKYYYPSFFRRPEGGDTKNSSFRSTDSSGSVSGRKKKGQVVSAHELHYTTNKAASQDMKKRTFLPYKQGILGRLAFNPRE